MIDKASQRDVLLIANTVEHAYRHAAPFNFIILASTLTLAAVIKSRCPPDHRVAALCKALRQDGSAHQARIARINVRQRLADCDQPDIHSFPISMERSATGAGIEPEDLLAVLTIRLSLI
ncbi:MAG: hypothetical protein ABSE43_02880 [Steroidobacteraceae bacterium]